MSDKPVAADLPRWGDGVDAELIEPPSGRKDDGWDSAQRPPGQYENWLLNRIYLWLLWISNGYFTRNDTDDNTPVVAFTDASGNERTYVDPCGYFMGPAINENYRWLSSISVIAATDEGFVVDDIVGTTDTNTIITGESTFLYSTLFNPLTLTVQNAAVNQRVVLGRDGNSSDQSQLVGIDNLCVVMEFRMRLNAVGASGVDVNMGFHNDPDLETLAWDDATAESFCMFGKKSTDTNWIARAADGTAGTDTDTGTPPVINAWQTFRIEYHGLSTPVGVAAGFAVGRFFIDGVEEAEIANANMPTSADDDFIDFIIRGRANATGPSADFKMVLSPTRFAYNYVLTPDVPA